MKMERILPSCKILKGFPLLSHERRDSILRERYPYQIQTTNHHHHSGNEHEHEETKNNLNMKMR